MSQLYYNGVTLHLLRTLAFEMHNERDPSGTDVLWSTYTVRVQGIPLTDGGSITEPTAPTLALIEHLLTMPRRTLIYTVDNTVLLDSSGIDAQMGPEVAAPAIVRQMTSGAIFVEVCYRVRARACAGGNPDPVVSLRWEMGESFNALWYARYQTRGRLIVRSDLRQSADSFRELCVPPVPTNFIRTTSEYTLSRSGCELDFNFVDEEQFGMPPVGARKASGRAMVAVTKGGLRFGQVDVHLESGPGANRSQLMITAISMAFNKLALEGVADTRLMEGKFSESLFENVVDVSLSAMLTPLGGAAVGKAGGAAAAIGLALGGAKPSTPEIMKGVGALPGSGPVNGLAPPIRRKVDGLLAAAFRDPCVAAAVEAAEPDLKTNKGSGKPKLKRFVGELPNVTSSPTTITPYGVFGGGGTGGGGEYTLTVADLPPSGPPAIVDSAPYDHYLIESDFQIDSGKRAMPGTGVGSDARKAKIVTLHGGISTLDVAWTASRTGKPPVIPARESADPNFTFLYGNTTPAAITIGADGYSPVYHVSGHYTYAAIDPDQVSIVAPIPPFLADVISPAAQLAAGFTSDKILWRFRGQNTPQQLEAPPDDSLAKQLGGAVVAGVNVGLGVALGVGPLSALGESSGGLDSGGGGSGLLGGSNVNP